MNIQKRSIAGALLVILVVGFAVHSQTKSATEVEDLATTLVTLKSTQDREQLLAKKKELMTADLRKALIRQGNVRLLAGQYATAFDIYGLARNIAEQIGDKEGVAAASLDIGTVYYFQANYPAALEHYRKARELFTEVTNNYESAKALSGVALIYKEQRRDAEALQALQQALQEFSSLGDKEEIANTLTSIGAIYYGQGDYSAAADAFLKSREANTTVENVVRLADALYMQGDYSQALNYYKESLTRISANDIGAYIASLNGAANSAYYQANYDEALQYYKRNAEIQQTQADKVGLVTAIKGIGNVHRSRGDYAAALESYFRSLEIAEQIKAPTGTILGSIGLVRALQGDYARAFEFYGKALKEFEVTSNKIEMARVLSLIGNLNYTQGDYDSALESYRRALALREEMDDKSGQGDVLSGIGTTLLRQKNYSDALVNYQKALALFSGVGNVERMADLMSRVSEAFLLQGEYAKALSAAESATGLARQADDPDVLWYARMLAGKIHRKLEHEPQAAQAFSEAVSIVESLRARPWSNTGAEHNPSLPYLATIDLLLSQHHPGEAFDYAEKAKVQDLVNLLRSSNAKSNRELSPEEASAEQRLSGEIASLEFQLDRERQSRTSSAHRQSQLSDRLIKARTAYADLRQNLFATHPRLKIDRGELAPLKLDDMRMIVGDTSTALLEYTITESNTYLFVLTVDRAPRSAAKHRAEMNLKVYPLEIKNDELRARVSEFEQQLASRADGFQQSAQELYNILIRPAEDQLVLKTRLVIVPDGGLWRLPFDALMPAEDHYLLDQMAISYAPSLSALREMRKEQVSNRWSLTAFANPSLSKEFTNRLELAYQDNKLATSEQQEEEIKRIATAFGNKAQLLTRGMATEERLKTEAASADILHFATPALVDDATPMSSFIGLSTVSKEDGFLQAREIINLPTTAKLVVLSDAQRKSSYNAGGSLGFYWSWFVAGRSSVMLNRWQMESATSAKLMAQFYSALTSTGRSRRSKGDALHQSLLMLRRSVGFDHPHYWASFALIGDPR